ncbi:hypothetical protein Scep_017527 [Stephania cephalantha]|uniref:Uncharacterized protein n=1 Tax=Stephania cephalantha TaxID=152367 RepID=A0AAP0IPR4_9MAGN
MPVKPSPLFVAVVYSVPRRRTLDTQMSVREMAELYGSEKSFVVEVHRALFGLHSTALIALERELHPSHSCARMMTKVSRDG